jgi:hypothetical protein
MLITQLLDQTFSNTASVLETVLSVPEGLTKRGCILIKTKRRKGPEALFQKVWVARQINPMSSILGIGVAYGFH